MSTFERTYDSNGARERWRVPDRFQTTNATQQTMFQINVPQNSAFLIDVKCLVYKSDFTASAMIEDRACFRRTTGNIVRASGNGGLIKPLTEVIGDFLSMPDLDLTANTLGQTIDIKVTGIAATTLNWIVSIETLRNLG